MSLKPNNQKSTSFGSLKFRLTFFFVTTLSFILIPLLTFLVNRFSQQLEQNFDSSLYNYTSEVANSINWSYLGELKIGKEELLSTNKIFPFRSSEIYLQIVDQQGNWLGGISPKLTASKISIRKEDLLVLNRKKARIRKLTIGKDQYHQISFPVIEPTEQTKLILQIAAPLQTLILQKRKLRSFLYWAIPILLITVFIISYFVSQFVLSPLNLIIKKTQTMNASDLSERLPVDQDKENELNVLSMTLNDLFDRIEKAFKSQEDFISNASHQLKTPLAIIKGELDVFKKKERSTLELNSFIQKTGDELNQLIRIVNNLLTLSSLDSGSQTLHREVVQLDEVIFKSIDRIKPLTQKKNIKIKFDLINKVNNKTSLSDFKILADSDLIITMFQSILENAVEYSQKGASIAIDLSSNKQDLCVSINNHGSVISEQDKINIFKRFYRSNTSKSGGVGLGLAISQKIANIHDGKIEVTSSKNSGTTFSFHFERHS